MAAFSWAAWFLPLFRGVLEDDRRGLLGVLAGDRRPEFVEENRRDDDRTEEGLVVRIGDDASRTCTCVCRRHCRQLAGGIMVDFEWLIRIFHCTRVYGSRREATDDNSPS